jgi:hypothetical protein
MDPTKISDDDSSFLLFNFAGSNHHGSGELLAVELGRLKLIMILKGPPYVESKRIGRQTKRHNTKCVETS